ncbi:ComEC/Rec2 family competence protein [Albimonas sp. CAU 1670]|uniref:ComEC/Rec2 family competence protein n=1 Tax=Albimonas sp. CAU 1670 TaxID=3032599 RepID=UPI0023DB6E5A|nr:ComEC/Rec2 family competence protein [Albimonas sp. CAU 1670]
MPDVPHNPSVAHERWSASFAPRAADAWRALAERERRRAPLWAPVLLGLGIWIYFSLTREPDAWAVAACVALPAALLAALTMGRRVVASVTLPPMAVSALVAASLVAAGFAAAALRAEHVTAPVLAERIDATVQGRVAEITRSHTDRRRVELRDLVIYGLSPERTPERVRVTLLEGAFARKVSLGERIEVFAQLGPPEGPVEPGGFDFRRHAWFEKLGGIGFARGPLVAAHPEVAEAAAPEPWSLHSLSLAVERFRGRLTDGILAALPGREGAFAAAILTGSREEVRGEEMQALRDSNLAHLLAISGLHMGLLASIVFWTARLLLAASPWLAVRLPTKKTAAAIALAAAAGYLAVSGASVATQRAFVMAAAALIAIMLDRPAISLRALAAAALAILALRPESLMDAGFQMSFAATAALVAAWELARDRRWLRPTHQTGRGRRLLLWAAGLLLTSFVAGAATAPFAAAHFNRLTGWGLPANLLAAPVMAFWVAPMGALSAALAPLGLHQWPLTAMGWGVGLILDIAQFFAGLPGAVRPVSSPPPLALPLLALGGLWLVIWASRLRLLGLGAMLAAAILWLPGGERPELLIAPRASAMGVLGPQGRAVDRARGAGYPISTWLANDGDPVEQAVAAGRPGIDRQPRRAEAVLDNGWRVVLLGGLVDASTLHAECAPRTVLVAYAARPGAAAPGPCVTLDGAALRGLGAVSVVPDDPGEGGPDDGGVRIRGALTDARLRLWGRAEPQRDLAD